MPNARLSPEVRELLSVLRDVLDVPPGEEPYDVRARAILGWSALGALLDNPNVSPADATRVLRVQGARHLPEQADQ
ncbi:hypothetical protein [Streptomyces sp. NBC_01439]|uniref:hypothetical protein n=1 Tax=Streptomyces sp. NBC_01439 TaxID=2903867 RepID=UPI002E2A22B6|nr:hypothetical protein [Streptomyces sp. NBC_01439]